MLTKKEIQRFREIEIHRILGIRNTGRDVKIRCPFHHEKTPSCVIRTNNSFKCFGCGIKGNGAIDFCQSMGYTFRECLEELIPYL